MQSNLRKDHPTVGAVFVATNDAMVEWALAQDWIDVVIPYHTVRTGKTIADIFGYRDFAKSQADVKMSDWGDAEKGTYLSSIPPTIHANDLGTYLKALEENHLTPRFPQWLDNPNYMKLVNETRMAYNKMHPVTPTFNEELVMAEVERVRTEGAYGTIQQLPDPEAQQEILAENAEVSAASILNGFDTSEIPDRGMGIKTSSRNTAMDVAQLDSVDNTRAVDYGIEHQMTYKINGVEVAYLTGTVYDDSSDEIYVDRIDVEDAYQNNGIGTRILQDLRDNYSSVIVAPDNEDAKRLYERIGSEYSGGVYDYVDQGYGVYEIDKRSPVNDTHYSSRNTAADVKDNEWGIFVHDSTREPFTDWILDRKKTVETRPSNTLAAYVGKVVGLVRSGRGSSEVVGYVRIGEPFVYKDADEFFRDDSEHGKHLVAPASEYTSQIKDIVINGETKKGYKVGYPIEVIQDLRDNPFKVSKRSEDRDGRQAVWIGNGERPAPVFNPQKEFSWYTLTHKDDLIVVDDSYAEVPVLPNGRLDINSITSRVLPKKAGVFSNAIVPCPALGGQVTISKTGLLHGLYSNASKVASADMITFASAAMNIPSLLENAIEVNRSTMHKNEVLPYEHILISILRTNTNGTDDFVAVRIIVDERNDESLELENMSVIGNLHAINAKKMTTHNARHLDTDINRSDAITATGHFSYSIRDLLRDVNTTIQDDTFSVDVYKHLGDTKKVENHPPHLMASSRDTAATSVEQVRHALLSESVVEELTGNGISVETSNRLKAWKKKYLELETARQTLRAFRTDLDNSAEGTDDYIRAKNNIGTYTKKVNNLMAQLRRIESNADMIALTKQVGLRLVERQREMARLAQQDASKVAAEHREEVRAARAEVRKQWDEYKEDQHDKLVRRRQAKQERDDRATLLRVAKRLASRKTTSANRAIIDDIIGDLDLVSVNICSIFLET